MCKLIFDGNEKTKRRRKAKRVKDAPRQALGKFGKWLFLFLIVGQNWLSVCAAAEGQQRRTEAVMRMQQDMQVKEHRWTEETSQRWRQLKGEDRTEMKKEARRLRCTVLNMSTWSTPKKIHEKTPKKVQYLFGE